MRTDPWVERADEPCPFCLQSYALELEVRCVACDRPSCPICAVRVRRSREAFCPACPPDAGSEADDASSDAGRSGSAAGAS
ncbi:MAG: hypothetical protein R3326_04675 [Gemmatimonadota bacterium]|nr:hypothetical protein [Gemmatimonadota bacterium]